MGVAALGRDRPVPQSWVAAKRIAHVLASAVRGFKQTATTPTELRRLIRELLTLSLSFSVA
jgi:hypothetical protein